MKPLVSVVMPVYNGEKYIESALQSLLQQSYRNFEVLIIDDCGTDASMSIVEKCADARFRVIRNCRNMGIAYSRNQGLANCSGEYIAILDDDDVSLPTRLESQVHFLLENEKIDVVGGESVWIDGEGQIVRSRLGMPDDPDYIKTSFLFENMYNNSEVMFRRSLIEDNDIRYQENMLGMEDFRFWIDCSKVGRFSNLKELLLKRRMVCDNTTAKTLQNQGIARKELYRELQDYSIRKSGFQLSQSEYATIHKYISEDWRSEIRTLKELQDFYRVLEKMVKQAEEIRFAEVEQVKRYMKERFRRCL